MELANFRVQKSVNISQEKQGSRVVQVETIYIKNNERTTKNREPPLKLCLKKAGFLSSPPFSAHLRTAHHTRFAVLDDTTIFAILFARHRLPPRGMELANCPVQKSVNISQEKVGS